ncbi:hypothetical protein FHS52_001128 [Erythromicrobium ramosum]|uniref:Uncharacterized protein n=1 Tax=Erythrobacter ramosus TaxID=35811 RepID=A0ABR6HWZ8_9SPHN|nr:hypothetical protein [Erythrobacter ramosus]MBB3775185.1 hypothetical protein [Erythrobacter ramosus]
MSFPTLPPAPVAPSRGLPAVFNERMQAMMAYIEGFPDDWNAVAEAADEEVAAAMQAVQAAASAAFSATSSTSLAIGSGTKSFSATPGAAFIGGMEVLMSSNAAPGTNNMTGTVTSYDAETGAMVVAVPAASFNGSGTYADWSIALSVGQAALAVAVNAAIASLLDGAPGALNTLNELAAALGDDANFAATVTAALALKANAADLGAAAALGVASQAQAEAGTATNVLMTPQRVAQAIDALVADGYNQIGSPVSTASGTGWGFSSIPATYQDLYVLISGVSTSATAAFQVQFSGNNGTDRTTASALGTIEAARGGFGGVHVLNYRQLVGLAHGGVLNSDAVNQAGTVGTSPIGWRLNAAILNSIFFSWAGGLTGDAGTITLFGR